MKRQTNILEYLDNIVKIYPERIAYANESVELFLRSVYDNARAIGSCIMKVNIRNLLLYL